MSDTQKNFLGIPIEGDIVKTSDSRVPQRPLSELQEELAALLAFNSFTALKWQQYTPYFNDGDPCVFSVYAHGLEVPDEDAGDYEDGFFNPNEGYGYDYLSDKAKKFVGHFEPGRYNRAVQAYDDGKWLVEPKHPKMVRQAMKVLEMISSGAFNDALFELFGDHASVVLRSDKIEVEFYEHD